MQTLTNSGLYFPILHRKVKILLLYLSLIILYEQKKEG